MILEDISEGNIRPQNITEFIGQKKLIQNLEVFIGSALKRKIPLDHILISGPPGLGKTTLANIVAREMNTVIKTTSGPVIDKKGDLAALLTNLEAGQILFVDEIHRLGRSIEEILYSAMEDFSIDLIIGEGPSAKSLRLDIPPFTLIGATTREGLLSSPLRDRFGIQFRVELYDNEDISIIVKNSSAKLDIDILDEAANLIGRRSRGTPRIANRLLKRCRDFAEMHSGGVINESIADKSLNELGIDSMGLNPLDRKLLETIQVNYNGGPVGIKTLAATLGEEKDTLEEVCEPFLLKAGFLLRSSKGRMISDKGKTHMHYPVRKNPSLI